MKSLTLFSALLLLGACAGSSSMNPMTTYESVQPATMMSIPAARRAAESDDPSRRGQYLVGLLGCATCHTDGALVGEPRIDRWMAGSRTGIAWSNPLENPNPGVVFPRNLTPDRATGLGRWSDAEIAGLIRSGVGRHGRIAAPVMPWPAYARLSDKDIGAIVAYLRSLPAVTHKVPDPVPKGTRSREPFVHFGVYRSRR